MASRIEGFRQDDRDMLRECPLEKAVAVDA
jgi:hypothetical protein